MTGIKYFRLKNRLTQKELAEKANCQIAVIQRLEQGYSERTRAITLHRIALALDVSLDNLARDYDDSQIDEQDRPIRPTKIKAPENCIHNYRLAHALTYQELAFRLGIGTSEGSRKVCKREYARQKHVQRLAAYEGISESEFSSIYGTLVG